jgi:hypothetical protein
MDVQTTTVPELVWSKGNAEKETTEISLPEPLIYIHLAVLQKMVGTS